MSDAAFARDAAAAGMSGLAGRLLAGVRADLNGDLEYFPKSGKYVEKPDNFWVVKVQPVARSLRIVVYGRPHQLGRFETLEVKPDLASYSTFTIEAKEQIEDAIAAIRKAKWLKQG